MDTGTALRAVVPIAGWGPERARAVEITGDPDPILPTPFGIGETSAAVPVGCREPVWPARP